MLLLSWNVNGLRAAYQKGFGDWLQRSSATMVCLQEIKARPDQLSKEQANPPGYQAFWFPAERPGYSGVASFSTLQPLQVHYGLGLPAFDGEGRVLSLEFADFLLVNAYFPNSQDQGQRLSYKLEFCQALHTWMQEWLARGKEIVLCGDFNIAHQPIDLARPKENEKSAGYLPEERAWMSHFLASGFHDIFREQHGEAGRYTWWSHRMRARERNIGWRLDYHCVSAKLRTRCKEADHHPQVLGSDHCPVSLTLD